MSKIRKILLGIFVVWAVGILTVLAMVIIAYNDLPAFKTVKDYRPVLHSEVLSRDGRLLWELANIERRYVLPYEQMPKVAIDAFVAGEDDRFFTHSGVDFQGIMRAALANLKAGRVVQGGSTITQQVAKSLLQNTKRSFSRKFKELILASRLEGNLTKEEILYIYLNQVYLGEGAYGIEAAARRYFHKSAKDLTIAEAAILAGLVQAPTRYSPLTSPLDARRRQVYVITRLLETGHINREQYDAAMKEDVKIYHERNVREDVARYYVEHVRQFLMEKYGQEQVYEGGLRITTAADYDLSLAATESVRRNLHDLDKRQGYRGPLRNINPEKDEMLVELESIRQEVFRKKFPFEFLPRTTENVTNNGELRKFTYQHARQQGLFVDDRELLQINEIYPAVVVRFENEPKSAILLIGAVTARLPMSEMSWAKRIRENEVSNGQTISNPSEALKRGDVVLVRVLKVPDLNPKEEETNPKAKADKQKQDDLVQVALEQTPIVQGSLLSVEANTGYVVAMVGGYSFEGSKYNRVIQAERQPGSAFKPFVFAAAIDKGFTPASIIVDAPIIFENQGKEDLKWIPENHSEKFYGDTTLRMALIKSRNVPTVKLLQDIQVPYLLDYAANLGIRKGLNADLSVALGSNAISLLDLTSAYALFPRNGSRIDPVFVLKIQDRDGNSLYEYQPETALAELRSKWEKIQQERYGTPGVVQQASVDSPNAISQDANTGESNAAPDADSAMADPTGTAPSRDVAKSEAELGADNNAEPKAAGAGDGEEAIVKIQPAPADERMKSLKAPRFDDPLRAMDARTAYVTGQLLRDAVSEGTGRKAVVLKRKVGGKTGTTSEYVDAWFMGFSPELITGVWVGFDTPRTLGSGETGARAALPAWINYMQAAMKTYTRDEYEVPKGIVFVRINPDDGTLASANNPNAVKVAFVEGTEPSATKRSTQVPDSSEFFKEDF